MSKDQRICCMHARVDYEIDVDVEAHEIAEALRKIGYTVYRTKALEVTYDPSASNQLIEAFKMVDILSSREDTAHWLWDLRSMLEDACMIGLKDR